MRNTGASRRRALRADLTIVSSQSKRFINIRRPFRPHNHTADLSAQGLSGRQVEQPNVRVKQPSEDTSGFLHKLPAELRVMIYQYVFRDHIFQLRRVPLDRTRSGPLFDQSAPARGAGGDHPLFPRRLEGPEPPNSLTNLSLVERTRERRSKWALLLTCRQIYSEAAQVFYGASTLKFDNPYVLIDIAANYLPRPSFQAIRRLEVVLRWTCPYFTLRIPETCRWGLDHPHVVWDRMWGLVAEEMTISFLTVWIMIGGYVWETTSSRQLNVEIPGLRSLFKIQGLTECAIFVRKCDRLRDNSRLLAHIESTLRDRMSQNGNNMVP